MTLVDWQSIFRGYLRLDSFGIITIIFINGKTTTRLVKDAMQILLKVPRYETKPNQTWQKARQNIVEGEKR